MTDGPSQPVQPGLRPHERRRVVVAGGLPVALTAALFLAMAVGGRGTVAEAITGIVLYGGFLGLTAAVLVYERTTNQHCPRCDAVGASRRPRCDACGYDLAERPLHRCPQRHAPYLESGVCACGQRLSPVLRERGLGRELRRILWAGAWLTALLLGVWLTLRLLA